MKKKGDISMNKLKNILAGITISFLTLFPYSVNAFEFVTPTPNTSQIKVNESLGDQTNEFIDILNVCANAVLAFTVIICVGAGVIQAVKIAKATNPESRGEAVKNLLTLAIVLACVGSFRLLLYIVLVLMSVFS